jgi:hypothetical protein
MHTQKETVIVYRALQAELYMFLKLRGAFRMFMYDHPKGAPQHASTSPLEEEQNLIGKALGYWHPQCADVPQTLRVRRGYVM